MASGPSPAPDPRSKVEPASVRGQLERLTASRYLVNSAQLCRFLRHVVERTLSGETDSLKESLLGTEVFERGARFDPRRDPVVRVEARRLRGRLEDYYKAEGIEDELVIGLPKGSYVPVFERRVKAEPPPPEPVRRTRRLWPAAAVAAAVLVLAAGTLWWRRPVHPAGPVSVAVLPFSNVGPDPETEYFADGLTGELIDLLGRTRGLRVVARSSVFHFKGRTGDAREIARQLNADLILEGSVRRQGQRLRISAELVDARNGFQSWSETLEREGRQVFAVQQEIAAAIASRLRVQPAGDRGKRYQGDLEAYNLCLKGRYYWNKRSVPGFEAAIAAFRQAIDRDPNYALAWAGLADSYSMLGFLGARPPAELRQHAAEAAARAVELDDTLPEAHVALGTMRCLYEWDWAGAEQSLRRALELDPNSPLAHYDLSKVLASVGRVADALPEARRAQELDPLSPIITVSLGWELAAARRYREADESFRAAAELDPDFFWLYPLRAWSYEGRGDFGRAIADLRRAIQLSASNTLVQGELAHALGRSGGRQEAEAILERLVAESRRRYVPAFDLARAYEGLGRRDEALAALTRACDERGPMVAFLKVEPVFDPMRADPRFQALLRRLRLE